jgi:hypothetical protein
VCPGEYQCQSLCQLTDSESVTLRMCGASLERSKPQFYAVCASEHGMRGSTVSIRPGLIRDTSEISWGHVGLRDERT